MSLGTANLTLPMSFHRCAKCFLPFGIPATMEASLIESHKWFYCPRGHPNRFLPEPTDPAEVAKRAAKIQELHDAEQAEARASEGKGEAPAQPPDGAADVPLRLVCPACGKGYRSAVCYHKHLRTVCKVEGE